MRAVGDSIDRFVIEAVLGEGGMGRVYRAYDPRLGRRVALKVMLGEGASDPARAVAAARMEREARAAAAFNHPNVVAIYDVGEVDGCPYIAMELVTGSTLRAFVADGRTSEAQRMSWLLDVARGLAAAHRAGLVHRDIKPDNVMITTDGVVKVLDFGIARRSDPVAGGVDAGAPTMTPNTPSITGEGMTIGTPQYMAPEQIRGEPLDGRADQFSWGVTAFEVLAGKLPWPVTASPLALFAAVLTSDAPPVRDSAPAVAAPVDEAIRRAMEKQRDLRFRSMDELIAAVEGGSLALAVTTAQPVAVAAPSRAGPSHAEPSRAAISPRAVSVEAGAGPASVAAMTPASTTSAGVVAAAGRPPAPTRTRPLSWRRAALVIALAAAAGGGLAAYRAAHREQTRYCALLETRADGPRCVLAIDAAVAAQRLGLTHRVTEVGGRVVRVEDVSFAGRRVGDAERTDVVRDESGAVRELQVRDRHENLDRWEKWSEGGRRVELVDDDGVTPRALRETSIAGFRRELDAQGRITRELFVAATGRPACDEHGAYGYAYAYGATPGRPIRKTVLGADGLPAAELRGQSVTETADDGTAEGRDVRYFDVDGKPMAVDGVYHHQRVFSAAAEETASIELGAHDEPVVNLDAGVHEERVRWDPGARTITETLFDEAGRQHPARSSSFSAVRYSYDERGREVLQEFLDAQGNRVYPRNAAAAKRSGWDERDDHVLTEHLDVTGALMQGEWGYARQVARHDERGRLVEQRHYDEAGKLALWRDGGAIQKIERDARGLVTSEAAFDAAERPVATLRGWSIARARYARMRGVAELSFSGPDGRPCVTSDGYATLRESYDDDGESVSRSYFDASGAPAMYKGEYATERVKRDALGNRAEEEYLDGHGERVLRRDGYAIARYVRDRQGDVVEASYFGAREQPVLREGGYARTTTTYDVHRRPLETTLYGPSGAPVAGSAGWTIERDAYDDRGLLVLRQHLDAARAPVLGRDGSAATRWTHDGRGNVVEQTRLGVDGKPVAGADGYATRTNVYDDRDQLVQESLQGADGRAAPGKEGWSVRHLRYDEMGNLVEEAFLDGDHHPVALKGADHASVVRRFDARQRLVQTAYFDPAGAPARGPEGAAVIRYRRDEYGHALETAYLDGAGSPTPSVDGTLVVRARYDDAGRPLEELYVDGAGAPRVARSGCAGRRTRYDALGRQVEESCLDVAGQIGTSAEGWAVRRTLRDARGNAVDESTHGPDGALRADREGVARRRSRYDERNLLQEVTYFDANDHPVADKHGAFGVRHQYDERGQRTASTPVAATAATGAPKR